MLNYPHHTSQENKASQEERDCSGCSLPSAPPPQGAARCPASPPSGPAPRAPMTAPMSTSSPDDADGTVRRNSLFLQFTIQNFLTPPIIPRPSLYFSCCMIFRQCFDLSFPQTCEREDMATKESSGANSYTVTFT